MKKLLRVKRHIVVGLIVSACLAACKKKEIFSEIPFIEYKSHYFIVDAVGKDSLVVLIFSFKDGDGDLGLNQGDTFPPFNPVVDFEGRSLNPYYYNLFLDYLEWFNGRFNYITRPFSTDTLRYEFRFPSLTPDGRHRAIRGDIEVKISPSPFPNARDTVMYRFFVYDRKLNKSNIAETPPIIWTNR